jgi:hypothetical protein
MPVKLPVDVLCNTNLCALWPAGQLPALGPPQVYSEQVDHKFTSALNAAKMIMAGEQLAWQMVSIHPKMHMLLSQPGSWLLHQTIAGLAHTCVYQAAHTSPVLNQR